MGVITKSPATLNKSNIRVVDEEGDGSLQIVGLRLEVGVENGHVLAVLDVAPLQAFSQSSCFVPHSVLSDLVPYVDAFGRPSLAFRLHQVLRQNPCDEYVIFKDADGNSMVLRWSLVMCERVLSK